MQTHDIHPNADFLSPSFLSSKEGGRLEKAICCGRKCTSQGIIKKYMEEGIQGLKRGFHP
jgi:hypothetical protein